MPRSNNRSHPGTGKPSTARSQWGQNIPPRLAKTRDIVLIDSSTRRNKERNNYQNRAREIKKLTASLRRHEEQDESAFRLWFQDHFGARLTEISNLGEEVAKLAELLDAMERYQRRHKVSRLEVFNKLSKAQAEGILSELMAQECAPISSGVENDPKFKVLNELYESVTGQELDPDDFDPSILDDFDMEDFIADLSQSRQGGHNGHERTDWDKEGTGRHHWDSAHHTYTKPSERDGDSYLKGLYRQLVRVLHPDMGRDLDEANQMIWHEVQDAYKRGDVERLSELHRQVVSSPDGLGPKLIDFTVMPIGDIIGLRKILEKRLEKLRMQVRTAKQELSWDFSALQTKQGFPLKRLRVKIEGELFDELAQTREAHAYLKRTLSRWQSPPKSKSRKASHDGKHALSRPGRKDRAGR